MYETWTIDEDFKEHCLYSGNDPVLAVNTGLNAPSNFIETWVTENGVEIPQTRAF